MSNEKTIKRETSYGDYTIMPIKTDIIEQGDTIDDLLAYAKPHIQKGDILFISEKVVSIIQYRTYNPDDIDPSKLAVFLSNKVGREGNLNHPSAMELAIREVGYFRILMAGVLAVLSRPFGKKGFFYTVAGPKVRGIDSPNPDGIPPYNTHISLAPKDPQILVGEIEKKFNNENEIVIIDANYRGVNVLGASNIDTKREIYEELFIINPLGQDKEQTPMGIVRKIED